ncbi:triose-phosphate isomerase [Gammaproteobacteria bacterium]|nr:triose-phosphate isomerase [Gammaproteobacteria bacterium]
MSLCLVANWKLNGSIAFNTQWALEFFRNFNGNHFSSIGIAPPSLYIDHIKAVLAGHEIKIGSQNIDLEQTGARTGEISASMIKDLGCSFSIVGHSERRLLFNETNQMICQKLIQANSNSIIPILCIGESAEENQSNNTNNVLEQQIVEALGNANELSSLIIAYEPVWAIGSGEIPNPEQINSIHEMIKDVVQSRFPKIGLESVLYGGSVNLENAPSLFGQKNVDGALIGGASLNGREFALIANVFNELRV